MSNPPEKCPLSWGMIESILGQVDILDAGMELLADAVPATMAVYMMGRAGLLALHVGILVFFRFCFRRLP